MALPPYTALACHVHSGRPRANIQPYDNEEQKNPYYPFIFEGATRIKPASRKRMEELAKAKQPRTIWITTLGRHIQWGDQESLWPIRKEALSANATPRLEELSSPKKNFQEENINREFLYSCGRSSMIWGVTNGAKGGSASARLSELSQPKRVPEEFLEDRDHYVFSCGRSSPIWDVSATAKYTPMYNPRFEDLSQPKTVHPHYLPSRVVETVIPKAALKGKSTERLELLATPRARSEGPFRDPMWPVNVYWLAADFSDTETEVVDNIMYVNPNKRITELSNPKGTVDNFHLPRITPVWDVSNKAKAAVPSKRIRELSQPNWRYL